MKASEPLLSDLNVIKRLDTLKRILKSLEEGDDPYEMKENVKTLINGYRSKSLEWHNGLVIYLSHGKQISQPRRYTYKEHLQIAKRYEGHKGFWVEGVSGFKFTILQDI